MDHHLSTSTHYEEHEPDKAIGRKHKCSDKDFSKRSNIIFTFDTETLRHGQGFNTEVCYDIDNL